MAAAGCPPSQAAACFDLPAVRHQARLRQPHSLPRITRAPPKHGNGSFLLSPKRSSSPSPFPARLPTVAAIKAPLSNDNAGTGDFCDYKPAQTTEEPPSQIAGQSDSSAQMGSKFKLLQEFLSNFGEAGHRIGQSVAAYYQEHTVGRVDGMPVATGTMDYLFGERPFFIPLYELHLKHGPVFKLKFGPKSFMIVSDPKIAKHLLRDNSRAYSKGILAEILEFVMGKGLIPAEEEIWRIRRRAIVPALHRKYVTAMIGLFGRATENLCEKLDVAARNGDSVEMESLFSRLTLDVIGKAVFNYNFDSLSNDTGIVQAVYVALREAEYRSIAVIPYWKIPIVRDLSPRQRKVNAALKLINGTLDKLIARSKRIMEEANISFDEEFMNEQDLSILSFLLAAGDDASSKQLRDDLMTLLIAGHETSAAVLTWAFYLLAKNPATTTKLQEEVDNILGDRLPTIDDMEKLKLTRRVVNETLRLYPEPPILIRRALQDDMIGNYHIKKGDDVFISVWNLHRSPEYWEDADEFRPERWPLDGPAPTEVLENFRYLPFGGGPRKCVGDIFATYETMTAIAMLVQRFNFQFAIGAPPVGMTTGATIHTREGLHMTVRHRSRLPVSTIANPAALQSSNGTP